MEWEPIETAPRDGTWVLCAWQNSAARWGIPVSMYWHRAGCWTDIDPALEPLIANAIQPLCWMPLPDPPATGRNDHHRNGFRSTYKGLIKKSMLRRCVFDAGKKNHARKTVAFKRAVDGDVTQLDAQTHSELGRERNY